jgi:hypothetical protein
MNTLESQAGTIIVTHGTPLYQALAEMTRAFFAYYLQLEANSQLSVVMTLEIKPIYEGEVDGIAETK